MLSYNDLPAHLKQCFAYCAVYPKDYLFCKDQVIHLWIANGLVQQFHSGNQYFLELRSRSLFEMVSNSSERDIEKFLMHDLVNDLAQIASSNLCIRLEENKGSHMLEQCRHMSYSIGQDGGFEKLQSLFKSEQLRTLLPINIQLQYQPKLSKRVLHNILPRLTSLRALSLLDYKIKELPDELFVKLKLLRYLDLSKTEIKKLTDSICALYNLETLLLSGCYYLEELPLQMEKLINLHYLDISNTWCLKMPLHLSKLKSLQVLMGAKFLLSGWRMEDLGEAQNLYGSVSVVELENVVDRMEAVRAKMKEKNHVDKLSLEWSESSNADNSQTERDILDELRPHKNIKVVEIIGYRGTTFPNWLADPLFLKLEQLSIANCKNCFSLPALGQLPCLKILSIRGMHGITGVTEEFYGSWSSKKPFNCLEKLEFKDMGVEAMARTRKLEVSGSPKVGVVFEGTKEIVELHISDCNSLTFFPFSILPTTLKRIYISHCQKLKLEQPVGEMSMFLEELTLKGCDCIDDISPELLQRARTLNVLIPTATETLYIWNGENVEKLSVACGWTQMTSLAIENCKKLKWLPERMQELLPSLEELYLINCPEIESFPQGGLPFNLQLLEISNCKKLVNGRKEWRLQRLSCLTELWIDHDDSDEEIVGGENWELPSSIQTLGIFDVKTLSSQHLKSLTSLQCLEIAGNLPQIQSMLEQGQFSHLTSLQSLVIMNFPNLQSLPESALPSSLSQLTIYNCPKLQSLPVKGMPSSLSKLGIYKCPLLKSLLEFDKGEYWPNIAQFAIINIDLECM
ncbi:hypothetical protein H5410_058547 [Solanum commersonii]|uniref:Uncharacterized protein n=1 Tax=Solanum commersonii TaxID=4109 RepID=A0A9J5WT02_SOLCO|nr:hypothetical protein H5410_058547 [Solanum commersonii]